MYSCPFLPNSNLSSDRSLPIILRKLPLHTAVRFDCPYCKTHRITARWISPKPGSLSLSSQSSRNSARGRLRLSLSARSPLLRPARPLSFSLSHAITHSLSHRMSRSSLSAQKSFSTVFGFCLTTTLRSSLILLMAASDFMAEYPCLSDSLQ